MTTRIRVTADRPTRLDRAWQWLKSGWALPDILMLVLAVVCMVAAVLLGADAVSTSSAFEQLKADVATAGLHMPEGAMDDAQDTYAALCQSSGGPAALQGLFRFVVLTPNNGNVDLDKLNAALDRYCSQINS